MTIPQRIVDHQDEVPPLLDAALFYASIGWHVFPVEVAAKRPRRGSHGLLDATTDPEIIKRWWTDAPFNIGISCGPSGLLVVDIDPRNGGEMTWKRFTKDHPDHLLSSGGFAESRTPSGGTHLFYRLAPDAQGFRKTRIDPGVDIQAAGGYVIVPPSYTLAGDYAWVREPQ